MNHSSPSSPIERLSLTAVDATAYVRPMRDGRHKAVLLECEDANGVVRECVVKLSTANKPQEWLVEWLAAGLAQGLSLPMASPCRVNLTPAFCKSLPSKLSPAVVFGSTFQRGGAPIPVGYEITRESIEMATAIIAFDALIQNPDRRARNPNLLVVGRDEFLMIDHDMAFSWLFDLVARDHATTNVSGEAWMKEHCLHQGTLNRLRELPTAFRDAAAVIDDAFFDAFRELTPIEWQTGSATGHLEKIVDVTKRRLKALDVWLAPLEAGWMR